MLIWLVALIALLATIVAAFSVGLVILLRRQLAALRQDYQRQATSVMALQGAMKALSEGVATHGQAQASVQRALERLHDQHSELRAREGDSGAYEQAIRLIQQGQGREEVRRRCGLTSTELDLLFSLHGTGTADASGLSGRS
ncbi:MULTISPECIES: DUF2802 domain-containing protein [unclassified Thioalkalivibrio]|uniref:DUF2802 domain-containing protein n=1 Tax=unclassified Thioalkalivibrio TaxID=2621013 RepID=UPI0003752BBA|nr:MULTISPECIES: DUF2802 domain-containing protein [unclassified Thioalkalivibrio]